MQAISDTPLRIMRLIDVHPFILRRSNTMYQPPQNPDDPTPSSQQPYSQYPPQQPYNPGDNQPTYLTPPAYPPYQYPPPPMPPKKRRTWLWIVLGVLAILILGCIGVSTLVLRSAGTAINTVSTTVASTVTTIAETPTTQAQPASQVSQVGGTITVNDVAVTLTSVKKLASDPYLPLALLVCIVTVCLVTSTETLVAGRNRDEYSRYYRGVQCGSTVCCSS